MDAQKKSNNQDSLGEPFGEINKDNPEHTISLIGRHLREQDDESHGCKNQTSNAENPDQGEVAGYVHGRDKKYHPCKGIHDHQHPPQIGDEDTCGGPWCTFIDPIGKP